MRVSVACSQFPPTRSGYARVAYETDMGLERLGYDVSVVTENSGCRRIWNLPYLDGEGREIIRKSDVVVVIGPSPPFTEQVCRYAASHGIPVIYITNAFVGLASYLDNVLFRALDAIYERLFYRRMLERCRIVFAQTSSFARHLGLKRTVYVCPFGIRSLPKPPAMRREKRALFVGQFRDYKGIKVLLRAAREMKRSGTVVPIDIAGSGPRLEWMLKYIARNSLDFVRVHVSPDDEELAALYALDSVFVLPSVSAESFGFVVVESASMGMKVVTSDLPGLEEVCRKVGGTVVRRRDPKALASAILRAVNDHVPTVVDISEFSWERNIQVLSNAITAVAREMGREVENVPVSNPE
ncbi:glycosyltransferase family 4 protein [Thermogymnomonas acidicola]|nr:glycosyltransferase family 4 protein [Thermogymnomonas acidicola]